jgi:hypothetical protein
VQDRVLFNGGDVDDLGFFLGSTCCDFHSQSSLSIFVTETVTKGEALYFGPMLLSITDIYTVLSVIGIAFFTNQMSSNTAGT